jgi:hypothetical protein
MELDYKLTRKQDEALEAFRQVMGEDSSWVLTRHQGTGLKFWRITWTDTPDWRGDTQSVDGKTLQEAISVVVRCQSRRQFEVA